MKQCAGGGLVLHTVPPRRHARPQQDPLEHIRAQDAYEEGYKPDQGGDIVSGPRFWRLEDLDDLARHRGHLIFERVLLVRSEQPWLDDPQVIVL